MSTINLAEVLILFQSRQPLRYAELRADLARIPIQFVPPTVEIAELAAAARIRFPLHLGDCFAYALARQLGEPILTLDSDFKKTDLEVVMPVY